MGWRFPTEFAERAGDSSTELDGGVSTQHDGDFQQNLLNKLEIL